MNDDMDCRDRPGNHGRYLARGGRQLRLLPAVPSARQVENRFTLDDGQPDLHLLHRHFAVQMLL